MFTNIKIGDVVMLCVYSHCGMGCRYVKTNVIKINKATFEVDKSPWLYYKSNGESYGQRTRNHIMEFDEEKYNDSVERENKRKEKCDCLNAINNADFNNMDIEYLKQIVEIIKKSKTENK